jgi:hypothetical protein
MPSQIRHAWSIFLLSFSICALSTSALTQQPKIPRMPVPPPMRFVTRSERSELDSARDPKARLRATLTLSEGHLQRAEALTNDKKFDAAAAELGEYLGLIGDMRSFIATLPPDKGSTRDIYRHFEFSVRVHIPRLAVMRRDTPADYSINIKDAEEYIKDTREEALDSFYGHSVLREPEPEKKSEGRPKDPPDGIKHP